ncbi:hypothetical protein FB45DRAFT_1054749 [Roridomyces roridus]|uniref:Uncharacterized protein n=1 Tax=Roridomyces roridus TaxID=1738132 RepID=A0AAD7FTJ5_9AGAR|nr:hypothetical protein FB45DRAFT_1054749 [Roridomyces roridus]
MSLSMDDLCSSLAGSHVGQEAIDLAALHAQLAQSMASTPQRQDEYSQPCNTPTNRTPSASFNWGQMVDPLRHSEQSTRRDDVDEDERMVEDLLIPTSPVSPKQTASKQSSPTDVFTSTDPFYMAQVQAAQNYSVSPPSVFSQTAFPSQQSPFLLHGRHNLAHNPLAMDAHALLVAASSSFSSDR